jgi:pilus assembly protein CpaC
VLGALFKSKSYQKQETELMFIVTAQLVKPSNPDDLPRLRGVDGLKNGSPLGVEPKGEGIEGQSGYSTGSASQQTPTATPKPATPAPKPEARPALPSTNSTVSFVPPGRNDAWSPAFGASPARMMMDVGAAPQR